MRYFVFFLLCSTKSVTFVLSWVVKNANISIQPQNNCVYHGFTIDNCATVSVYSTVFVPDSQTHSQLIVEANSNFKPPLTIFARDASSATSATSATSASIAASPPLGLLYPLLPWSGNFTITGSSPGSTGAPLSNVLMSTRSTSARVISTTVGSHVLSETFAVATLTSYSGLVSTVTVTTLGASNSLNSFTVGPGGIYWTPSDPPLSTPYPPSPYPAKSITVNAPQISSTDAFANNAISETTVDINGMSYHYSRTSFPELATVTGITTVTTPVVNTNKDGSQFTVSAAVIVVGPHGV